MSLEEEAASYTNVYLDASDSSETRSNPPDSEDLFENFKDSECGEPLLPQHLVLDFTPNEEDTEYIQKKCCAFWEFVNSQPDLEHLIATPDMQMSEKVSDSGEYDSSREQTESSHKLKSKEEKTAVSMLELVEKKGLIDRAFTSRLPTSHCSLGLMNYQDEDSTFDATRVSVGELVKSTKPSKNKKRGERKPPGPSSPTARAMCQKLQQWDSQHPKSMEPPGPILGLDQANDEKAIVRNKSCICKK